MDQYIKLLYKTKRLAKEACQLQLCILSVTPRTIARMMDDGRLRRVGMHVDVRSICDYIENPKQMDFTARMRTKRQTTMIRPGEFYTASCAVKSRKGA